MKIFTPSQGKYRIYIIDEVHMLTKEAFNALLKTLEEPPKHAVFILATTEIHRVPATILSRCQRFDFKRIPTKTIIGHLKNICTKEKITISDDALLQIAKKADGSMRDSQSILDQIISYSGEKISAEEVASALGIIDQEIFFRITENIQKGNLKEILDLSQSIYREGYDLAEFLLGFEEHLRNMLVTKTVGNTELLNVSEDIADTYQKECHNFDEIDLLRYMHQIDNIQNSLKWSTQPQLKFEIGLLKLAKMPTTVKIESILEKIDLLKKKSKTTIKAVETDASQVDQPPSEPPLTIKSIQVYWKRLIEDYRNLNMNLANALEFGTLVKLVNTDLILEYSKKNTFHLNLLKKHQQEIENHLKNHFQQSIKIEIHLVDTEHIDKRTNQDRTLDKKSAQNMIKDDPLLNKLVEELGLELT